MKDTLRIVEEVLRYPFKALNFAKHVTEGPFLDGEPVLATDPKTAYLYAYDVLRDRFYRGEETIAKSPDYAYFYARDVIKGRWKKGEEAIYSSIPSAILYSEFLKELYEARAAKGCSKKGSKNKTK